jgi:hypothetical protein
MFDRSIIPQRIIQMMLYILKFNNVKTQVPQHKKVPHIIWQIVQMVPGVSLGFEVGTHVRQQHRVEMGEFLTGSW